MTADGRLVDAHGQPLEAAPEPKTKGAGNEPPPAATPLPDDFPHRDALAGAGITTVEQLAVTTDTELRAIPTIGPAAVRDIRAA